MQLKMLEKFKSIKNQNEKGFLDLPLSLSHQSDKIQEYCVQKRKLKIINDIIKNYILVPKLDCQELVSKQ